MEIADLVNFWTSMSSDKLVRMFWFFFFVEVPRYLVLDLVILAIYHLHRNFKKDAWDNARNKLWNEQPLVTVLVPGKDEGENYHKLVRTLEEQTYRNIQLIIVDDGSEDNSLAIGRRLERQGKIDLFIRNEVRGGKASAANTGLRFAKGKFIVHLDADSSLDFNAIENLLVPFFYDDDIGAVAGNLGVRNTNDSICTSLQTIEYMATISVGRLVLSYLGLLRIVSGAHGAFRADVIERVGGWDIGPGLDGDITVKIRKMGYKIYFEPTALCLTNVPDNFNSLTKQRLRWSKSLIRFRVRKHGDIFALNRNFSLRNMLSSWENIFYNLVLNFGWFIYLIDVAINMPKLIVIVFPVNYIFYTCSNYIQFFASLVLRDHVKDKLRLLMLVPLSTLYTGYYIRFVRTIAYIQEFFYKTSYEDPWNPAKTSFHAKEKGI
ncbi:glycosyltransferase family 2 protein [Fodinibius saliphilus]|uniref:glycosyltransferase family 2 protein n=1 Tax=Fodinibius saliphilus TaxID=1920650 RepID=UPI001109FAB5|nr:glycosyltransferase [Fodinibius saliphilus]